MSEIEKIQLKIAQIELVENLKKTNRLYAVVSSVNKMILHIKDPEKIFSEACRIACEEGKFTMAWIGLFNPETGIINPHCWAGHEDGYLHAMTEISAKNIPQGRGPTGTALREKKTVVNDDFETNPNSALWRPEALKRGYASSIALPIFTTTKLIGAFTLYSSEKHFFNEAEVKLLEDLTANIAFALETIENERIRREAEIEIAEKNNFIKIVTDSLPGLVAYWTRDLRCTFANHAYEEWFGKTESEMVGIHVRDLLGEAIFSKSAPFLEKVLKGEAQQFERTFTKPDGTVGHFYIHMVPNFINGIVHGYFLLGSDITKLKHTEKLMEEEKLINASKMAALGEMASGIAHEVNNPLSIIIMKISQLRRKFEENILTEIELDDGLQKVATTAQRIGSVVKGLSTISRNAENDPMKKIKICTIIEDTLQLCRERFKANQIELQIDIEAAENIEVDVRAPQIMQVILNLLNNAFDATTSLSERWISVKALPTKNGVEIFITDSGKGIPDPLLGKIMQPFFTTKDPGKGTGLGLSISKGIIEEHHGEFYYKRNSSNTCFVIALPRSQKA